MVCIPPYVGMVVGGGCIVAVVGLPLGRSYCLKKLLLCSTDDVVDATDNAPNVCKDREGCVLM